MGDEENDHGKKKMMTITVLFCKNILIYYLRGCVYPRKLGLS